MSAVQVIKGDLQRKPKVHYPNIGRDRGDGAGGLIAGAAIMPMISGPMPPSTGGREVVRELRALVRARLDVLVQRSYPGDGPGVKAGQGRGRGRRGAGTGEGAGRARAPDG